jgi:hypothetical protein
VPSKAPEAPNTGELMGLAIQYFQRQAWEDALACFDQLSDWRSQNHSQMRCWQ